MRESTLYLDNIVASPGILTKRKPSKEERQDIEFGWQMAKEIGRLDIGQTVVVKDQAILAVEAIEGTDEAIRRGGLLCGQGAVVVKVCKPQQDLRFDLPAIGTQTIKTMEEVKASCLAVEAGKTIIIEREAVIHEADRAGIAIVAVHGPEGSRMKKVRVGVIGVGYLGQFHAEKYAGTAGCRTRRTSWMQIRSGRRRLPGN